MKGKGPPPRPHYRVFRDGAEAGEADQRDSFAELELRHRNGIPDDTGARSQATEIEIEIRGQKFPAMIEKKPLYKKS